MYELPCIIPSENTRDKRSPTSLIVNLQGAGFSARAALSFLSVNAYGRNTNNDPERGYIYSELRALQPESSNCGFDQVQRLCN